MPVEVLGESAGLSFAPSSWDWRDKGAVGPVMNQGMMGDAQAFVASGTVTEMSLISSHLVKSKTCSELKFQVSLIVNLMDPATRLIQISY